MDLVKEELENSLAEEEKRADSGSDDDEAAADRKDPEPKPIGALLKK